MISCVAVKDHAIGGFLIVLVWRTDDLVVLNDARVDLADISALTAAPWDPVLLPGSTRIDYALIPEPPRRHLARDLANPEQPAIQPVHVRERLGAHPPCDGREARLVLSTFERVRAPAAD